MARVELTQLIETGAHFGHLTRRWNPKMKPYIFMEKNGIHIIDLKKTQKQIDIAADAITRIVSQGKKILFVGTKKQAKGVIASEAKRSEMNWVSERWLGGMLTNFSTIRKSVKRLQNIDKMESDGTFDKITKKEILFLNREKDKLRKVLDGIESLNRLPGAMFIVDIKKESIAVKEALRLNIPIFAIVDTNCDPDDVDYLIAANDDAVRAIEHITKIIADAAMVGSKKAEELKAEENAEKEKQRKIKEDTQHSKDAGKSKIRKVKFDSKGDKKEVKSRKKDAPKSKTESTKPAEKETKQESSSKEDQVKKAKSNEKEVAKEMKVTENNTKDAKSAKSEDASVTSEESKKDKAK